MYPDELNISDAALTALRDAGWIGKLVRKGAEPPPPKAQKKKERASTKRVYVMPPDITLQSKGARWNRYNGHFEARVCVRGQMQHVRNYPATQDGADACAAAAALACNLRDAGHDLDAIRTTVRERVAA